MILNFLRISDLAPDPGQNKDNQQITNNRQYPHSHSHLFLEKGLVTAPKLYKPLPHLLVPNSSNKSKKHDINKVLKQVINAKAG